MTHVCWCLGRSVSSGEVFVMCFRVEFYYTMGLAWLDKVLTLLLISYYCAE